MNDASFHRLLRSALLLSMASSGVVVACGGTAETAASDATPSSGAPTAKPTPPSTSTPPGEDSRSAATEKIRAGGRCDLVVDFNHFRGTWASVYDPCGEWELPVTKEVCLT